MKKTNSKKFKVGDIVTITNCFHGHEYEIGSKVTIVAKTSYDYRGDNGGWYFVDEEAKIYKRYNNRKSSLKHKK